MDAGDGEEETRLDLYELLDLTPSGIAEWIMPLVLAANLNKIEWIKPSFSSQISEGNYRYAVGVKCQNLDDSDENAAQNNITTYLDLPADAKVKVDFNHPYYLDDDSVEPSSELFLKQNLELRVTELRPVSGCDREENFGRGEGDLWMLDICLDYFACYNPYISDLESRNFLVTRAFLNVMENSKFSTNNSMPTENNQPDTSLEYQTEIILFYKLLGQVLTSNLKKNSERPSESDGILSEIHSAKLLNEISRYFETPEQAKRLIWSLVFEINKDNDSDQLCSMVIEAIPNWSMPHDRGGTATAKINESLGLVEKHIRQHLRDKDEPFLITVARSTDDGFCPPEVVEILQHKVLDILHRLFCDRLLHVRDYGEWEGSVIPK